MKKPVYFPFILLLIFLFSCVTKKSETLLLGSLVKVNQIEKAVMHNNSGSFELSNTQLKKLKRDLSAMEYVPKFSAKTGSVSINLTLEGKTYLLRSSSRSQYLEISRDFITNGEKINNDDSFLYFKTNGVNFNNYTPKK